MPPYNTFLEALYSCGGGYMLAIEDNDRLFCSSGMWDGKRPQCLTSEDLRQSSLMTNSVSGNQIR
jgi:hypothetical protein